MIKYRKLEYPESDLQAFDVLAREKVISEKLAEKLQDAKRIRNIIAHEYGSVDDEIVFNSITEELKKDVRELIKDIKRVIKKS